MLTTCPLILESLLRGVGSGQGEWGEMRLAHTSTICILLLLCLLAPSSAEELSDPLSLDRKKTQHFEKFMMSNSCSVPVTVMMKGTFENAKLSKKLPVVFVVSPRGKVEAFNSRAKDPRAYYTSPDVSQEYQFGDYRISTSNQRLVLPWKSGKSFKVVTKGRKNYALDIEMPEGTAVTCARPGLVVRADSFSVEVAHNDGSVSRYLKLGSVSARVGKDIRQDQPIGVSGDSPLHFELAAPDRSLKYRAIPAKFTVKGSPTLLSTGKKYKR